jgi:hypothetical protein
MEERPQVRAPPIVGTRIEVTDSSTISRAKKVSQIRSDGIIAYHACRSAGGARLAWGAFQIDL